MQNKHSPEARAIPGSHADTKDGIRGTRADFYRYSAGDTITNMSLEEMNGDKNKAAASEPCVQSSGTKYCLSGL